MHDERQQPHRSKHLRRLAAAACVTVLVYVGMTIAFYSLQSLLVYRPTREIEATPSQAGMAYEDVRLTAADGTQLAAWYVPTDKPRGVLLFCHGSGGNIWRQISSLRAFHRMGLSVLVFDYRGYGQSQGTPTEKGTYQDAEAAWQYLVDKRRQDPNRIVIFGRSLGGSVAAHLAIDHRAAGLVVESTFTSVPSLGRDAYWFLPVRWMVKFNYATADYLRKASCPVMVIHSRNDEVIPFHHGQQNYEAASNKRQFLEITGNHNYGWETSGGVYIDGINQFLKDVGI